MVTVYELLVNCKQIMITICKNNYKYPNNKEHTEVFRYYVSSHLF